jgi:A/G-specific adenine glycosylase
VFPWRTTDNPFHLLIAELMLRRTHARQVVGVYTGFVVRYPDPYSLATAPTVEVETALYSLGLAWRVPAFQQLARVLVEQYNDQVPTSYDQLLTLPGVGDYVASAVATFAFNQPVAIIDTNTVRVVGRLFGIPTHAESRRSSPVRKLLQSLIDRERPRDYNYALLDLAALICTPKDPACSACPLSSLCVTGQQRLQLSPTA